MRKKGNIGEKIAKNFLEKRNYIILDENYIFHHVGEIDIIAQDLDTGQICAIEVKFRTNENFGEIKETITSLKLQKIFMTLLNYAEKNNIEEEKLRIDFIGISKLGKNKVKIHHIKNLSLE